MKSRRLMRYSWSPESTTTCLDLLVLDVMDVLAHGVGRPLVPVGILDGLLGGEDLQEAVGKAVETVGLRDVAVQGSGVELGQDHDFLDVPVQAVGDGNVDEAELAADRNGGLGPELGQRIEPGAPAAAKDDR